MSLGRDSSKIREFGGDAAIFKETDASGCYTGATITMPIIEDMALSDQTAQNERTSAKGTIYRNDGARTLGFDGNWMQTDIDTLKAMSETYRGKRLFVVAEWQPEDKTYLIVPVAKVDPSIELSTPGGQVPFALSPEPLSAELEVDLTDFASSEFSATLSGSITIPQGAAYYWHQQV